MGGAYRYGNLYATGYDMATAALSTALFNTGSICGTLTATDFCPSNWSQASNNGGWCNLPRPHFDLAEPIFLKSGHYKASIIPVAYCSVTCVKRGTIRFTINGNPFFNLVTILMIRGDRIGWYSMTRNWVQNWQCNWKLMGQGIWFMVTTSDGRVTTSRVVDSNWQFGQTFQGAQVA
ncbi:hypothetical protein CY35_04G061100 [Sphagnum magellanicum]|nr:hypothetical protein CY35_04G061100 [Sphagnum magellanicum]